jgi:hypothetical protein
VGYACFRACVHSASLSRTRASGAFLLRGTVGAFNCVRQNLKLLQTRRQRESIAGDKCVKTCCQISGGQPAVMRRLGPGFAMGKDILGFLAISCATLAGRTSTRSASLSLRFAPACAGPVSRCAGATELEASETSISDEQSPSSSGIGGGWTCVGFGGRWNPFVAIGCGLVGSAV